ncbi:MAG: T9SS type A sorting domain-containing protein [Flavobacteriales bacterium]|nr:T9SS type A sorting domain-containing protein [Flavobacteriales bacterium]
MKSNQTFLLLAATMFLSQAQAQFITRPDFYSPTGVATDGSVAGYLMQAGPYSIWNPDLQTSEDIGGIAPGNGVGGQARFSTNGNFISGTSAGPLGATLSIYDRTTEQWTPMADLGFPVDNTTSGGYAISGDGSTVVGNSWADTTGGYAYTHAIASNASDGVMDLGTLFFGRSTRANAVNADGSVVVGWQDFNGPWKSAVWRRNPDGSYAQNHYILLDDAGDPNDEFNQMGECSAVSADGEWIGGYGDYANNGEPWIWSQDSGVINLGHLPLTGTGYVGAMNADASIIVGWFDGELWGDPMTPFIWTPAGGLQNLNTYITEEMGIDLGDQQVSVANCISSDGRYIAGWGVDNALFSTFAYRLDLGINTSVGQNGIRQELQVYPNPTSDRVMVSSTMPSTLCIVRADGALVAQYPVSGSSTIDLGNFNAGVYTFILNANGSIRTARVVKN